MRKTLMEQRLFMKSIVIQKVFDEPYVIVDNVCIKITKVYMEHDKKEICTFL